MMQVDEFRAMNSDIMLAAEGKPEAVARGFAAVRETIAVEEARFTRFSEHSELAKLNRAAGTWFRASPQLYGVLMEARRLSDETEGLFNPAILRDLEAAGYDRSMEIIRAKGVQRRFSLHPRHAADFRAVLFNDDASLVRLPRDMRVDLGGIAKGWIAETAAHVLSVFCDACAVNAGGDLYAIGLPTGEAAWPVTIEDPRDARQELALLRVGPGALATSSITRRRWVQNEREQHHLIDPRTGLPAATDWLSVTAIAPSATVAEVFAKALLIAGSREAPRLASRRGDVVYIAVDRDGRLWGPGRAKEYMDVNGETERA